VPIYHLVNASISFHNIFGTDGQVPGVTCEREETGRLKCGVDESLFNVGAEYKMSGGMSGSGRISDDEDFFELDKMDWGEDEEEVDVYEALNAPRVLMTDNSPEDDSDEQLLQRLIEI